MSKQETGVTLDPTELSDTRRAVQSELDKLRSENTRAWEKVFNLESEIADKDTALMLLKAQVARQADQIKKFAEKPVVTSELSVLDDHPEAGPT